MVEKAQRVHVDGQERETPLPSWEVFVREDETDPLRHVGSVAASDAGEAESHASRLFGWYAVDLWVCPAGAIERYSTRALSGRETETADRENGDGTPEGESDTAEPRVYEETEGTPEVNEP